MRQFKYTLYGFAVATLAATALTSCTNALDGPGMGGNNTVTLTSPTYAPDLVAWSGPETFNNTITGTRSYAGYVASTRAGFSGNAGDGQDVGQGQTNPLWAPFQNPSAVGEDEKAKVLAALAVKTQNGTNGYIQEEIVFPWENYYLQDVVNGNGDDLPSHGWSFYAYNNGDYPQITGSANINNHAVIMENGSQKRIDNTALMVNMGVSDYLSMRGRQFYFHMNCHDNLDWLDSYIVVESEGNYYICFDYACVCEDKDNGNEMLWHDWDYDDYIIKISYAKPVNSPAFEIPMVWRSVNNGDSGNDENNGNDDNGNNGGDTGSGDNNGNNSGNTGNNSGNNNNDINEVEINFALNDIHYLPNGTQKYDIADLVSKLSIHVRYPKDVEVIIPVPEKFYCDQDDLYILKDHNDFEYGGESISYDNNIGNNTVTLTVEFIAAADDDLTGTNEGYIRVYTEGINEDVIKYCREQYGDGINFEVYNYYNRGTQYTTGNYAEITYDELQWKYLSRSMVNFDHTVKDFTQKTYPNFYINAFNKVGASHNPGDCYVWIMGDHRAKYNSSIYEGGMYDGTLMHWTSESQDLNVRPDVEKNYFWNAYQGTHYNSSPYNWIYTNKAVKGSVNPEGSNAMPDRASWPFSSPYSIER